MATRLKSKSRREAGASGTLSARIMDSIGRRIVSGEYCVGGALPPEVALCAEYGLSRTPLREAMKKLHAKGLIAMAPKSGTHVLPADSWNQLDPDILRWRFDSRPDEWLLGQLYELRIAFEPEACRLAAVNGGEADHAAISAQFERMAAMRESAEGVIDPDIAFHMAIVAATRNVFLMSVGAAIRTALKFQFRLSAEKRPFPARELEQHRLIRDAILARDGPRAAEAMRALVALSRDSLAEFLRRTSKAGNAPAKSLAMARSRRLS